MTIVQSINPMTSKTAGTIEGAGAGAALGAGIGYMLVRKPTEDTFIKNSIEIAKENLLYTRDTALKILKKMNNNKPVSEKLLKSIADNGYTIEELANKENVKNVIVESTMNLSVLDNGKRWENALKRLENSTHPDKEIATAKIKMFLEKEIKPYYESGINEVKETFKAGANDEAFKEITGYIKRKSMGKFALIGAVALGVAGYFASKYFINKK